MKKIRIVHFVASLNHGGAEMMILNLCRIQLEKNSDLSISIISVMDEFALKDSFKKLGVEQYTLMPQGERFFGKMKRALSLLKQIDPQIVHTHTVPGDFFGQLSAWIKGVPIRIVTAHDMTPTDDIGTKIRHKLAGRLAHQVVAVSQAANDYYQKQRYYSAKKTEIIYTSPSFPMSITPDFSLRALSQIIAVGRFDEVKDQVTFAKAAHKAFTSSDAWIFQHYGSGDTAIQKRVVDAADVNGETLLTLCGTTNDIQKVMSEATILVSTSLSEACPLVVLEGLQCGTPMILSDIPAHREIFSTWPEYPYFFEPANYTDLYAKIKKLISQRDEQEQVSSRLLKMSEFYSIRKMVERYTGLYNRLLSDKDLDVQI